MEALKEIIYKKDNSTFEPNLNVLLKPRKKIQFVIEYRQVIEDLYWFRIIRIKNKKRTHEFIINDFTENNIIVEVEGTNEYAELRFKDKKHLIEVFTNLAKSKSLYSKYTVGKEYNIDEESILNEEQFLKYFSHL